MSTSFFQPATNITPLNTGTASPFNITQVKSDNLRTFQLDRPDPNNVINTLVKLVSSNIAQSKVDVPRERTSGPLLVGQQEAGSEFLNISEGRLSSSSSDQSSSSSSRTSEGLSRRSVSLKKNAKILQVGGYCGYLYRYLRCQLNTLFFNEFYCEIKCTLGSYPVRYTVPS